LELTGTKPIDCWLVKIDGEPEELYLESHQAQNLKQMMYLNGTKAEVVKGVFHAGV
jgi:hypothetical protein